MIKDNLKLLFISHLSHDDCDLWVATPKKDITIQELINKIKDKTSDWGEIYINEKLVCEYNCGKIIFIKKDLNRYIKLKIKKIVIYNGWSRADYYIGTKEGESIGGIFKEECMKYEKKL